MDSREAKIYVALLIAVVVLGIFIAYFILSIIRQQKRVITLQQEQIMTEMVTTEKERTRIARDLHDEFGPQLSAIKFKIDYVHDLPGKDPAMLREASEQVDILLAQVREIARSLMPAVLLRKGLFAAVTEYIQRLGQAGQLTISFTFPPVLSLTDDMAIHIYRMLQEVIHNCVRHAEARHLYIKMEHAGHMLQVTCQDDGKGFEYEKILQQPAGMGLQSLKNRATLLGGTLLVESKPGQGSAFIFNLPLSTI